MKHYGHKYYTFYNIRLNQSQTGKSPQPVKAFLTRMRTALRMNFVVMSSAAKHGILVIACYSALAYSVVILSLETESCRRLLHASGPKLLQALEP